MDEKCYTAINHWQLVSKNEVCWEESNRKLLMHYLLPLPRGESNTLTLYLKLVYLLYHTSELCFSHLLASLEVNSKYYSPLGW